MVIIMRYITLCHYAMLLYMPSYHRGIFVGFGVLLCFSFPHLASSHTLGARQVWANGWGFLLRFAGQFGRIRMQCSSSSSSSSSRSRSRSRSNSTSRSRSRCRSRSSSSSRRPPPYQPPPPHTPLTHIRFTRYLQYFRHVGTSYEA